MHIPASITPQASLTNVPSYDDLYGNDKPPPSYQEAIRSGPPPPYIDNRYSIPIPGNSIPLSHVSIQPTNHLRSHTAGNSSISSSSSTVTTTTATTTTTNRQPNLDLPILMNDVCPICQGPLLTDFPFLCWVLALCWFPIGVLCCLLSARKRCGQCGITFS